MSGLLALASGKAGPGSSPFGALGFNTCVAPDQPETLGLRVRALVEAARLRLSEASHKRLDGIARSQVYSYLSDAGELDAEGGKLAKANLSGILRGMRDNPEADQALADVVSDLLGCVGGGGVALRRTLDPALLNRVANDPDVRPWLQGEGEIDLGPLMANVANFALVTEGGGFFVQYLSPGEYEVHSMFLASARSRTVEAMRAGMAYMFTRTPCQRLVTKVPSDNKPAANLASAGGFKPLFHRDAGGGVAHLALTIDDWAMGNPALEAEGEWFHQRLEDAKAATGSALETHDHDAAHERAVGAAVLMMKAGNVAKGLHFYNRWAVFAGYQPIALLTETPTVLELGDVVAELRGGDMEILLCR